MSEVMETAPRDGTYILVYNGSFWQLAFYRAGRWRGAHHSSWHGNELDEGSLVAWMKQPDKPTK